MGRFLNKKLKLKKKRLVLLAAVVSAVVVGAEYGYWASVLLVLLLAALLGLLRGMEYALAHAGVKRLARACGRYNTPKLVAALRSRELAEAPFTFVVLGDTRSTRRIPPVIHRRAKDEAPAFVFNTGDLARFGTAREYANRYLPLLAIMDPIPVFSVPGNHDRGARNDFAAYRAVHGDERFSFDFGPCRFIGVNNGKRSRMKGEDLEYLHRELSKSPVQYKFVFIHIPPRYFEDGVVTGEKRRGFKKLEQEFRTMMAQHQVTEVFMGHIHGYASKEIDGVRYTLTAGAGAPLSRRLPAASRVFNYVAVRVDKNGLEREVVRFMNGEWTKGT